MAEEGFRVLIGGGGVAGLEVLMALRALAGEQVELLLVAPEDEFVYRPLTVEKPYSAGRIHRVPLGEAAADVGAGFASATIQEVDAERKRVKISDGDELEYEALVLALGAEAVSVVPHALTWDDRAEFELIGGFVQDFEAGYSTRLAVVIPTGPGWPLRGYELALFIADDTRGMGLDIHATVVEPDPSPLEALGSRARSQIMNEVEGAGIAVVQAAGVDVEPGQATTLVLSPGDQRIEVDRILALPALRGRPVAGVPTDASGFVQVDAHCRVDGLEGVWAVGDGTAFPVKSGGFAAEEADVAADDIAALAGADVERRPFDPSGRDDLLGLPAGRHMTAWLSAREGEDLSTSLPAGRLPVLTYLARDLAAGWRGD